MTKNTTYLFGALLAVAIAIGAKSFYETHGGLALFGPDDWSTCLLAKENTAGNDVAAQLIAAQCGTDFPRLSAINRSGEMFAKYASANECFLANGTKTASPLAAQVVYGMCQKIYDPISQEDITRAFQEQQSQ